MVMLRRKGCSFKVKDPDPEIFIEGWECPRYKTGPMKIEYATVWPEKK
jgi:hypothetical protein